MTGTCSEVVAVKAVARPVVDAEDRQQVGVPVRRRVGRARLAVEHVAAHVVLGTKELRAARIEDEHVDRRRGAGQQGLQPTGVRAVPLVGDGNRGDAAPPRPLELRLRDGRGRARQPQHRKRCDQQAEAKAEAGELDATHWFLLPSSLFSATLRCAPGPVMTTIDPLLALVTRRWDDQIWLLAEVMTTLPGPLRLSPSFEFV